MAGKAHTSLNVMKKPLGLFSKEPMTGFYRNGYCDVGAEDKGNHSIAATLTDPFLDFSASRGNNLRSIGLTAGKKWCLCASRWKEAMDYASQQSSSDSTDRKPRMNPTSGQQPGEDSVVPKVHLHATHERALDVVKLADLKKYAAEPEAGNMGSVAQSREGGMGGALKEGTEMAGKGEMTGRE